MSAGICNSQHHNKRLRNFNGSEENNTKHLVLRTEFTSKIDAGSI